MCVCILQFTAAVLVVPPTMPFPHHSESIGLGSKRPKNLELRKKIGKMFKVTSSKDEDSDASPTTPSHEEE
jgi:hypothetical protein